MPDNLFDEYGHPVKKLVDYTAPTELTDEYGRPRFVIDDLENMIKPVVGEYYQGLGIAGMSNAFQLVANRLYAWPLYVHRTMSFDRIACFVNTLDSPQAARLGIYLHSYTTNAPGALLKDCGEVNVSTTGMKTITLDPAVQLAKGIYFLAMVSSGVPYVERTTHYLINLRGWSATPYASAGGVYAAHTYGALPDPFPSPTLNYTVLFFMLPLRVASLP